MIYNHVHLVEKMYKMGSLQFFFYFLANDFISLLLSLFLERKPFTPTKHQSQEFCWLKSNSIIVQ